MKARSKSVPHQHAQGESSTWRGRKLSREEKADEIVDLVLARARSGDLAAARLILDKHFQGRKLSFELRAVTSPEDASRAMSDVLRAMSEGKITLEEAERVSRLLKDAIPLLRLTSSDKEAQAAESGPRLSNLSEALQKFEEESRRQREETIKNLHRKG